ncbi:hypothetical protein IGI66_003584 [Enterococcus sp. AZ048]
MNSFSLLLLILMVLILCRKAFKLEKLSRFERITLPSYSLIMFMLSMNWTITTFIQLILIIGISVVIGFYQLTKVEIKVEKNLDQYNRPVVLVKKYRHRPGQNSIQDSLRPRFSIPLPANNLN